MKSSELMTGRTGHRHIGALSLLSTLLLISFVPQVRADASATTAQVSADASAAATQGAETKQRSTTASTATSRTFWLNLDLDLSETYLTNVLGSAVPNQQKGDYDSRARIDLGLHDHTERLTADVSYSLAADYFLQNSSHFRVTNNLNALADAIIIPGNLFLDARAFAAPVYVSSLGALAPSGATLPGNAGNIRDTYGYEAQPKLTFRLGDFAKSDLTAQYGAAYLVQPSGAPAATPTPGLTPPPANISSFSITEGISNGSFFNRMNWDLSGSYADQSSSAIRLMTTAGLADLKYAVSREFQLLTKVGYETFDASPALTRNLNGIVAMGGVRFTLGPAFDGSILAGRQYNSPSYTGDLHYEMSPTSSIVAALKDTVTTPAARLLENLSNMAATDEGAIVDSSYLLSGGVPSTFSTFDDIPEDNTSFDNAIARYRTARATLLYETLRTHLSLTAFGTIKDDLSPVTTGTQTRQTSVGLTFLASRNLTPNTTATLGTTYSVQTILGGRDNIISFNGEIRYALAPDMSLYARAAYVQRLSSSSLVTISPFDGNVSDAQFTIGIRRLLF
jgi:uncharacterized protein (PEP-CTERM system associated)